MSPAYAKLLEFTRACTRRGERPELPADEFDAIVGGMDATERFVEEDEPALHICVGHPGWHTKLYRL